MDIDSMTISDVIMLFSGKATYEEGMAFLKTKAEARYGIEACRIRAEADGLDSDSDDVCLMWAVICLIRDEASATKLN